MAKISGIKALIRTMNMTADEVGEIVMSLYVHQVKHGTVGVEEFRQVIGEVIETTRTCAV